MMHECLRSWLVFESKLDLYHCMSFESLLICAINLPHANLLTSHTIRNIDYHTNKTLQLFFLPGLLCG